VVKYVAVVLVTTALLVLTLAATAQAITTVPSEACENSQIGHALDKGFTKTDNEPTLMCSPTTPP
jgi:hypothetical protein